MTDDRRDGAVEGVALDAAAFVSDALADLDDATVLAVVKKVLADRDVPVAQP